MIYLKTFCFLTFHFNIKLFVMDERNVNKNLRFNESIWLNSFNFKRNQILLKI